MSDAWSPRSEGGERTQIDFRIDHGEKWMEEEIRITLRNRKTEPVQIIVKGNLYRWTNWEIIRKSYAFEQQDYRTIHFLVGVEADEEVKVTYTVRYTW